VQGELERVLSLLLRAAVATTGAGRTDAGVHAAGQVVSFASEGADPQWLMARANKMLAPEISVRAAAAVPEDFDARFSAVRREYEYRAYDGPAPDPFRDRFALYVPGKLSLARMRSGARALTGEHDFSAFCRRGDGSMTRRVRRVGIARAAGATTFEVIADSFCHQMVRSVVGLLLEVGKGKRAPEDVGRALASRDRARAGPVAPARGLTLVRVVYKPDPFGPGRAQTPK
jgi:tRNA pseudouridine38-40 synthase